MRLIDIQYYHVFQGTVKNGKASKRNYPVFMQKNLDYFKSQWGKVPDHLPADIRFV